MNDRFTWALTVLDIRPQDRVLEIGCGAGLLVEQIINKLTRGSITAIDRSASMVTMASKRNAPAVASGKAKCMLLDFSESMFKENGFDKIVAFNINFFWKNPERELEIIKKILKPTGQLYIFYQAPTWLRIEAAEPIKKNLEKNSFEVIDVVFKKMTPTPVFCIRAQAAS